MVAVPAKTDNFAVNISDDIVNFAGLRFDAAPAAADGWRVEKRKYTKKNGVKMIYYNFRSRRSVVLADGRRVVPYRPGGKYAANGGENEQ